MNPNPTSTSPSSGNNPVENGNTVIQMMSEVDAPHRPPKRRGGTPVFDDEDNSGTSTPVNDQRIVITTEQFVDALVNDKARTDEFFCQAPGCTQVFVSAKDYNTHYMSRHMYKCDTCRREMPGSHLLELHVLENHDTLFLLMAERKPMFSCVAEECPEKFKTSAERYSHFHTAHKKHPMFGTFRHFELIHSPQPQTNQNHTNNGNAKENQNLNCSSRQKNKNKSKTATNSTSVKSTAVTDMEVVEPTEGQNQDDAVELISADQKTMEESAVENTNDKEVSEMMNDDVSAKRPTSPLSKSGSSKKTSVRDTGKINANSNGKSKGKGVHISFGHHSQKFKFRPWHSTEEKSSQGENPVAAAAADDLGVDTMDLSSIQNVLNQQENSSTSTPASIT